VDEDDGRLAGGVRHLDLLFFMLGDRFRIGHDRGLRSGSAADEVHSLLSRPDETASPSWRASARCTPAEG
jgi:hypothetical protein